MLNSYMWWVLGKYKKTFKKSFSTLGEHFRSTRQTDSPCILKSDCFLRQHSHFVLYHVPFITLPPADSGGAQDVYFVSP